MLYFRSVSRVISTLKSTHTGETGITLHRDRQGVWNVVEGGRIISVHDAIDDARQAAREWWHSRGSPS